MDQGPNIYRVAEDTAARLGGGAYAYLCEQAEMAKLAGDRESAITWWDIALAVIEITSMRCVAVLAPLFALSLA